MMGVVMAANQVRSGAAQTGFWQRIPQRCDVSCVIRQPQIIVTTERQQRLPVSDQLRLLRPRHQAPAPDRKSTRLNSSHVKISYAVFCLKKKTNKEKSGIQ